MNKKALERQTKYHTAIKKTLALVGHASNAELLDILRQSYPDLSATTVHRATARLALRNIIKIAPQKKDGSTRYDNNLSEHDHFQCTSCEKLVDTDIKDKMIPIIESTIDGCNITGRLTVNGICKNCINHSKERK